MARWADNEPDWDDDDLEDDTGVDEDEDEPTIPCPYGPRLALLTLPTKKRCDASFER